ncbi:hypothetical protein [Cryobacterium sp. PH29-G1]|uniref:hypothetical protein n=1 Tax=Cryobacterium sp. PH29-G1 TaxID=3046211 RepID=UPI0024B9B7BC|nr:hypothetical protein [Cryobacterium sp. PH29-G1]MDJ0350257.1 hypothetical protein [Cryobacterium sp. PH29-G1]
MTSIDEIIAALGDWRGDMLVHIRGLILEADADELFNASQTAGVRRAIDLYEGDKINATACHGLVRAAAALNAS